MKTPRNNLVITTLLAFLFLLLNLSAFCYDEVKYIVSPGVSGTWHPDTLYVVTVNIHIAEEDTLHILPGTQVEFEKDRRFEVSGVLLAEGTQNDRIVFSRIANSDNKWNGIRLMSAKGFSANWISKFKYCDFSHINANDGAALSVNNGVSDISDCSFSDIDSNGIVIQSGCPAESINFTNNTFSSVIGYPVNIYQNYSLSDITVKHNNFSDCHAGVIVNTTQITSFLFEDNQIINSQLDVSFLSITGNPFLNSVVIKYNDIQNVTSVDDVPYIVYIYENAQLDNFEFTNNEVVSSIRMLWLEGVNSATIEGNDFSQSQNIVFEHLYHISADNITISNEAINQMDLKELGASYSSLYSLVPANNVSIDGCFFNEIEANCFFVHPDLSFSEISILDNHVIDCNSVFNDGGVLRLESVDAITIERIRISDNTFSGVVSDNYGGTIYMALSGSSIGEFISEGNSYDSETDDSGGVIYMDCASVSVLKFIDDIIIKGEITDSNPDEGTGGFLSLQLEVAPDTILVKECDVTRAHAFSDGGFMFIDIEDSDSDFALLKLENIVYRDVQSDVGNGGFLSLYTSGGVGTVQISGVETEGAFERKGLSGGFVYMQTNRGPEVFDVTNSNLEQITASHLGGHIAILTEGDINTVIVDDCSFSSNPSSEITPLTGGALYFSANNVDVTTISNNTFNNLASIENGGMIFIAASEGFERQEYINNNFGSGNSGGMGGAIYLSATDNLPEKCLFAENDFSYIQSGGNGGAVYIALEDGDMEKGLLLSDNAFESCSAGQNGSGGSMFVECGTINDSLMVKNSSFADCEAYASGGALYFLADNIENIIVDGENSSGFNNCVALNGDGGALFLSSSAQGVQCAEFKNMTCNGNQASTNAHGMGGFVALNSNGNLMHALTLENLSVNGFSSEGSGGVFYLNFYNHSIIDIVDVNGCEFENCIATGDNANGGVVELIAGDILADITIYNNSFDGCTAGFNGGAMNIDAENIKGVNVLDNGGFNNCTAGAGDGGAISFDLQGVVDGDVVILRSGFFGNSNLNAGGNGGALSFKGIADLFGEMKVLDSEFSNMRATGHGGAISFIAENSATIDRFSIKNNQFTDCSALDDNSNGGAAYFMAGVVSDTLSLHKNVAANCSAGNNGGAFGFDISDVDFLFLDGDSGEITFTNCSSINGSGGAVYTNVHNGGLRELSVKEISFSGSDAGTDGGGLYVKTSGNISNQIEIISNMFSEMTSGNNGGGICIDAETFGLAQGAIFEDNIFSVMESSEGNGGALFILANTISDDLIFGDNSFSECAAGISGGAIHIEASDMGSIVIHPTDDEVLFENCHASAGNGGAVNLELSGGVDDITLSSTYFSNCSAGSNGGAFSVNAHQSLQNVLDISSSSFSSCSAGLDGGSVFINLNDAGMPSGMDLSGNSIVHSTATNSESEGGAIAVYAGEIKNGILVHENLFEECIANKNGGALSFMIASVDTISVVSHTSPNGFINCSATNGSGGALNISLRGGGAGLLNVMDNDFDGCSAGTNGGAIIIADGSIASIDITNTSFSACHVNGGDGGAIHLTGNTTDISLWDNDFVSCYAANGNGGSLYVEGSISGNTNIGMDNIQFMQGDQRTLYGGAAYLSGIATTEIEDCSFGVLSVGNSGGALFLNNHNDVSVINSSFSRCQAAEEGGAIWLENSNAGAMTMVGSHFEFSKTGNSGGAIWVNGLSDLIINDSELLQNSVSALGNEYYGGGAIYAGNTMMCTLSENKIYDNHAQNDNSVISTFGGGAFFDNCQEIVFNDNDLRLNEAVFGGGIYISQDIKTSIYNNLFSLNKAINGGGLAIKSTLSYIDSLSVYDNEFLRNVGSYRGGGVFVERDKPVIVRNKFIRNTGYGKGSSIFLSRDVSKAEIFNSVFDRNEDMENNYNSATVYLDAATSRSFNNHRLTIENCSFLNNWPYAAHAVMNKSENDTIHIINSVFQGNVLQNDSLFNNRSVISDYCRLEGDLFDVPHTNMLPAYYPYELESESYMLSDDSYYIDLGNPSDVYHDNSLPPGLGELVNDPGHTGGRYNSFCDDCLEKPGAWMYNDSLVVVRTDCDAYRVSFYHSMATECDHFQWFIDGETYITDENVLEFTYAAEKNVLLLAIASSSTEAWTMSGRAWIYNLEIVHDGLEISYSPDGTMVSGKSAEVEIEIVYGEDCLEEIELEAKLRDLVIPDFDSYTYEWSIEAVEGISNAVVTDLDEDEATITFSIDKEYSVADDLYVTLYYSGIDGCGLQCSDEIIIRLITTGFTPLEVESITPVDGEAVVFDQFFLMEITMNQECGYLSDGVYHNIPLDQDIKALELVEFMDESGAVELDSVKAYINDRKLQIHVYPDTSYITFDKTYSVEMADNIITQCGWSVEPFEYEFSTVETGITDLQYDVSVHPNPVITNLVIRSDKNLSGIIRVMNISGKIVSQCDIFNSKDIIIDMSAFQKGIYLLEIIGDECRFMRKIIKE